MQRHHCTFKLPACICVAFHLIYMQPRYIAVRYIMPIARSIISQVGEWTTNYAPGHGLQFVVVNVVYRCTVCLFDVQAVCCCCCYVCVPCEGLYIFCRMRKKKEENIKKY